MKKYNYPAGIIVSLLPTLAVIPILNISFVFLTSYSEFKFSQSRIEKNSLQWDLL